MDIIWHQFLSLVPTCPKSRKNQGFLPFPDTGILTTIAILTTVRFTHRMNRRLLLVFTCDGEETTTEKFYHLKFVLVSKNCKALLSVPGQRSPDRLAPFKI